MKSIFNDINLLQQFDKIINIKLAQSSRVLINPELANSALNELFDNLNKQVILTDSGKIDKLDIMKDLKNLESFIMFLYNNKVKYKGEDIVKGLFGSATSDQKPEKGYVIFERENRCQVNVEGIWAYINDLMNKVKASNNKNAIPYVQAIMDQLNRSGIKGDAGPATVPSGGATGAAPTTDETKGSASAPGTTAGGGAVGPSGEALNQNQEAAKRALYSLCTQDNGPLFYDSVHFDKIESFLKNYSILKYNNDKLLTIFNTHKPIYEVAGGDVLHTEPSDLAPELKNIIVPKLTTQPMIGVFKNFDKDPQTPSKYSTFLDILSHDISIIRNYLEDLRHTYFLNISKYDEYARHQLAFGTKNMSELSRTKSFYSGR